MKLENEIILNEIYHELLIEKNSLSKKVEKNNKDMNEIEQFIKSLHNKEDKDYKIFSPRVNNNIYKEEIEREKVKKVNIENDNHNQYEKINRIHYFMDKLEIVINQADDKVNLTILDIQELDRQRIARDLHDTSLQELAHIVHMNELASLYLDEDTIKAKLQLASINKNLREVIEEIRKIIFDLRPMSFDDLGFKDTLEDLFSKLTLYSKIEITYSIEEIKCTEEVLITLYRVISECCNNSIRHSQCTNLNVKVYNELDNLNIEIEDNGVGFDLSNSLNKERNHFGLKIMKERIDLLNGKMELISNSEAGTKIVITIPNSAF